MGILTESISADNGPPDLTAERAIRDLWDAVERVNAAGYVVTGELSFVRPHKPGLVEVRGFGRTGPVNRLDVRTFGVVPGRAPAPPPAMPVAVAEAVVAAAGIVSGVYTGETCVYCHGCRMRRAGTCAVCEDCGASGNCG